MVLFKRYLQNGSDPDLPYRVGFEPRIMQNTSMERCYLGGGISFIHHLTPDAFCIVFNTL